MDCSARAEFPVAVLTQGNIPTSHSGFRTERGGDLVAYGLHGFSKIIFALNKS
jgi:hypothetical protein